MTHGSYKHPLHSVERAGGEVDLQSSRTTLNRYASRGHYDFETVSAILDEGFLCHVGFVVNGQPYVIPTGYGRDGRTLDDTSVLSVEIAEASAKVRVGPPHDDEEDCRLPIWAGLINFPAAAPQIVPDPQLAPGIPTPGYVSGYRRPKTRSD